MQSKSILARRFQFTLNEFDKYGQLADAIKSKVNYKAMISCKETAPSTGHVHCHIYAMFSKPVRWIQVCGEHIEPCRGSHKQNIAYICKNGDIIEKCNIEDVRDTKMTAKEMKSMSFEEVENLTPAQVNLWNKIRYIEEPLTKDSCYKPDIKVYYIWGDSDAGKTKYVYNHLPEGKEFDRVYFTNNFWNGCRPGVEVCWYDDWRDTQMKPDEFIHFVDYYVNIMNVKGGWQYNRYRTIFITSVQDPSTIYKNVSDEPRKQWEKRITPIHLEGTELEELLSWK